MENKIERKDFRPVVRYTEFKIRRLHANREHDDNIKGIQDTLKDNIKGIQENAAFQIKIVKDKADNAIRRADDRLNEILLAIANDQADFEDELRNYIANLSVEDRKALAFLKEGGQR